MNVFGTSCSDSFHSLNEDYSRAQMNEMKFKKLHIAAAY
jgi:hypothetical protein